MQEVMDHENLVKDDDGPKGVGAALINWKVWYFTAIYFCLQVAVYGTTFYLPQQVASLTGQKVGWQVGLISAIPWAVGLFTCYYAGKHATTVRRRRNWGALFYLLTGVAILVSAWAGANGLGLIGLIAITVAVASFLADGPITWSFPTAFLAGTAAAAGIGLINSLGNLGGFVAPLMRAAVNDAAPHRERRVGCRLARCVRLHWRDPDVLHALLQGARRRPARRREDDDRALSP